MQATETPETVRRVQLDWLAVRAKIEDAMATIEAAAFILDRTPGRTTTKGALQDALVTLAHIPT